MIDHFSITVSDDEKSKAFYQQALAPTGHTRVDGHNVEAVCHEAE